LRVIGHHAKRNHQASVFNESVIEYPHHIFVMVAYTKENFLLKAFSFIFTKDLVTCLVVHDGIPQHLYSVEAVALVFNFINPA
jgi:hypothetical protein